MLRVNNLIGFGVPAVVDPLARFVGVYNANFGTSLTVAINVPIADFQYPADDRRQIVVGTFGELHSIDHTACNINGTIPLRLIMADGYARQCVVLGAVFAGTSDFTINLTRDVTTSEDTDILVFETYDALACVKWGGSGGSINPGTVINSNIHRPRGASILAFILAFLDTTSFTWSGGVTEIQDVDAGSNRVSGAIGAALTSADQNFETVTATASASDVLLTAAVPVLRKDEPITTVWMPTSRQPTAPTIATNTATLSAVTTTNHTGYGKFRLFVTVGWENDNTLTGITRNGVAMTFFASASNAGASPDLNLATYYLDIDADVSPTGNIVATFSGTITRASIWTYRVYSNTPIVQRSNGASANAAAVGTTIDVGEGGHIVAFTMRATAGQLTTWSGVTQRNDSNATDYQNSTADSFFRPAETGRSITATGSASGQCLLLVHSFGIT